MANPSDHSSGRRDQLLESARDFGTPQYFLDEDALSAGCGRILDAFRSRYRRTRIFYPYKTNSNTTLLKRLHGLGIGAETASLLEMRLAQRMGAKDMVLNGPGKTQEELRSSIGISTIMLDSLDEGREISRICQEVGEKPRLGVRMSLSAAPPQWRRFGIPQKELPKLVDLLKRVGLSLEGVHFHIGGPHRSHKPYQSALKEVGGILGSQSIGELSFVDVGGGFASPMCEGKGIFDYALGFLEKNTGVTIRRGVRDLPPVEPIESFASGICDAFHDEILSQSPGAELWAEPGRWLAAPSMHALMRVVALKVSGAVLDGGIGLLPAALHERLVIVNLTNPSDKTSEAHLYGPLCMSNDMIGDRVIGGAPRVGDILCALNVGAYNATWASHFIKPLAKVVSSSNGRLRQTVREEDIEYRLGRDLSK